MIQFQISRCQLDSIPENFRIDPSWFDHQSSLHGQSHTLRVMILSDLLYSRAVEGKLEVPRNLYRNLMAAALIHDLARKNDGLCLNHGLWGKETKRLIAEKMFLGYKLPEEEWRSIGEAVEAHSRHDPPTPYAPGSLTALLKDADGLDRVRLSESPDPTYSRHPFTVEYVDLAWELLDRSFEELERSFFG